MAFCLNSSSASQSSISISSAVAVQFISMIICLFWWPFSCEQSLCWCPAMLRYSTKPVFMSNSDEITVLTNAYAQLCWDRVLKHVYAQPCWDTVLNNAYVQPCWDMMLNSACVQTLWDTVLKNTHVYPGWDTVLNSACRLKLNRKVSKCGELQCWTLYVSSHCEKVLNNACVQPC
jgi:hypothetical protein